MIHCYNKLSVTTVLKIDHSPSISETKQSRTLSYTEYTFKCRNQRDNSGLGKTQQKSTCVANAKPEFNLQYHPKRKKKKKIGNV